MSAKKTHRKMTRTRSRRNASAHAVTGIAATAMAGAMVLAVTASQATADPSPRVLLTTSSSSLQPVIDQILAEQQAAVTANEALPFAHPDSNVMLPTMVQNMSYQWLINLIARDNGGLTFFQSPELIAGDAANSRLLPEFFTADIRYANNQGLDPGATYELTGTVGAGTGTHSISPLIITSGANAGFGQTLPGDLQTDSNLVVNPDGTYTVVIGPTEPSGAVNYIDSNEFLGSETGGSLLLRYYLSDWAKGPGSFHLECVADCPVPNPGITDTGLSDTEIHSLLNTLGNELEPINRNLLQNLAFFGGNLSPENTMSSLAPAVGQSAGFLSTLTSKGNFDLQPDQALIVKVPDVPSAFSGIEVMNAFAGQLPTPLAQTTLNDTQAFHDPDGFTYYVISGTNPGVANWLDNGGLGTGTLYMRIAGIPDGTDGAGLPVTAEVVPVADVRDYLPADTPTVSPAEFAADMNERVLSSNYALDISRASASNPTWVTQQLWLHDLQATMGSDNFHEVFGEQPFTPMWLRLTPALSPAWGTIFNYFLTNPSGSWTAIQDNLALAHSDIAMPIQLTQALLEKNFTQTADAVQSALSSGDLMQALTALFAGGQQVGSILTDALFDPNTSITQGILNARDDLATAIMTANGGFPTELGPLATWEWEHMSELTQLTPASALAGLGSLFNLDDLFGA